MFNESENTRSTREQRVILQYLLSRAKAQFFSQATMIPCMIRVKTTLVLNWQIFNSWMKWLINLRSLVWRASSEWYNNTCCQKQKPSFGDLMMKSFSFESPHDPVRYQSVILPPILVQKVFNVSERQIYHLHSYKSSYSVINSQNLREMMECLTPENPSTFHVDE